MAFFSAVRRFCQMSYITSQMTFDCFISYHPNFNLATELSIFFHRGATENSSPSINSSVSYQYRAAVYFVVSLSLVITLLCLTIIWLLFWLQ